MNRAEALLACDSSDWSERKSSIPFIGEYRDDDCKRAMLWLLSDEDIGVCQEAGRYLIAKNDVESAILLFMGLAIGNDQKRYGTLDEIKFSRNMGTFDFDHITNTILKGDNFLARAGVRDAMKWLKLESELEL